MLIAFFTLSVCECSTFFFINGIFKIEKLKSSLEPCFLLRAVLRFLWYNICFYKLFLINENKHTVLDTYYINSDYPKVHKTGQTQEVQKDKKLVFQKISTKCKLVQTHIEQNIKDHVGSNNSKVLDLF